eukprot:scaffold135_cov249-Pinguiococcus_pyrenoidosus.AAC.2
MWSAWTSQGALTLTGHFRALADGLFVVVESSLANDRVYEGAIRAGLQIVSQMDVIPRAGKPPLFSLFALQKRRNAVGEACPGKIVAPLHAEAALHIGMEYETFVVRDASGRRSEAYLAMLSQVGFPPPRLVRFFLCFSTARMHSLWSQTSLAALTFAHTQGLLKPGEGRNLDLMCPAVRIQLLRRSEGDPAVQSISLLLRPAERFVQVRQLLRDRSKLVLLPV